MNPRSKYAVEKSNALLARARQVEALVDARPGIFFNGYERVGGFPLFVEKASGPYLWDVDGNRYIDYVLGYGSVVLGHADPVVVAAVQDVVETGCNPTLLSISHIELAERIVALSPGAESVTFFKTGSDATSAAVRLSRAVTRRKYVLQWGMHGWHDWCAHASSGVLDQSKSYTLPLRYNDLDHAESLFSQYGHDVACVILMPYEIDLPNSGYLQGLRALCHQHGALFILDEIRSGFRISMGGAQAYFGIQADLVTYGKAMANGHAISALAGSKKYMKHILEVGMSVTYYRMPDSMVAALTTIEQLNRYAGPRRLSVLGQRLKDGLERAARLAGVAARSVGHPATPFIQFDYDSEVARGRAMRFFCNGMLKRGVILMPTHHWFLCTSMQEQDIDETVSAASEVFEELRVIF